MGLTIQFLAVLGAVLYPLTPSLLALCLVMTFVPGLSISMMFHRYHTHQSFKFKSKTLERFFTLLGMLGMQRGPIWWASVHRHHHQATDTPMDPHDSEKGFWYAHVLWLGHLDPRWEWSRGIDRFAPFAPPQVGQDPFYRFLEKFWYCANPISWIVLYWIGGAPWLFWGGFIAIFFNWHNTWLINSASHFFGYRPFNTRDRSTNNALVALLALGDGWHNNHHAFPASANHGFYRWWEFDISYAVVWIMEKLGLVTQVKRVSPQQIESKLKIRPGFIPVSKPNPSLN